MNERTLSSFIGAITPLERALLASASFSIIATDAIGIIQLFNAGAERMLGYCVSDVINQLSPTDMLDAAEVHARAQALSAELHTAIVPGFEALAFKASRGIADSYELTQVRKDGTRFPCITSITALRDDQGNILGFLLIGADNSLRAAAEAERNRALALAETAVQAKARFLSSMSHELHTPLNSILGFAQLIQTGTPPPSARQKHSLEQIEQAGWYLLELINQLLELAEIQSGQLTLNCEAVELTEVFKECQAMMEPQASRRSIATQFPVNSLAFRVQGDRTRVRQVLLNLLSNAVKYNREGGAIIVACEPLSATRLRITVADSGPGLNQEQLAQLFQPFNRLGREHSAEEGTGIGLVMTKYLVEMMDGEIGVISNPGQGCVFWVDLTLSQDIPGHLNIAQV